MFDLMKEPAADGPVTFASADDATSFVQSQFDMQKKIWTAGLPAVRAIAAAPFDPLLRPEAYRDVFFAAERQQVLVDNVFAESRAIEEAYDRRIAEVKRVTGIDLENPMRGGYSREARQTIRQEVLANNMAPVDAKGGIPEYQRRIFDERVFALQQQHPDLTGDNIDVSARDIAHRAEDEAKQATEGVNPVAGFIFGFGGGLYAGRRDPIFLGSLFMGPTSAVGKTVLGRAVSAGLFQGLFNAGVTAMEQPAVQAWRNDIGVRSGVVPAMENVGMSFLFGLIPGAVLRGVHEAGAREVQAARPAIERAMRGAPEPGDVAALGKVLGPEHADAAVIRMGEDALEADSAILPRPGKTEPQLHDDMTAAALKHADDPVNEPPPEAIVAVREIEDSAAPPPLKQQPEIKYNPLEMVRRGELTADRAVAIAEEMKDYEKQIVSNALGADADAWRTAHRKSDRYWDQAEDAKAREQDQIVADIESRHPRDVVDEMYRRLEQEEHTDPTGWRDFARDLRDVEGDRADAVTTIGYTLRRLPDPARPIRQHDRETIALIQHALDMEAKRGGDAEAFLRDAFHKSGERYGGGADAAEIIASDMEKLRALLGTSEHPPRPGLPSPLLPPKTQEIAARIKEAQPQSRGEALEAATQALEDTGRRNMLARLNEDIAAESVARGYAKVQPVIAGAAAQRPARDPLSKVPFLRDDGTPVMLSRKQAAEIGQRETEFAMLVRSCK